MTGTTSPPYWLLPGFSQTAGAWGAVVDSLPTNRRATALDIPTGTGFVATADALAADRIGVWAGYSMGGRLALQIALDHPAAVQGLALVSATPGITDPDQRLGRRRADEDLAQWIEARDTTAFLGRWLAQPMFAGLDAVQARRHRLISTARIADQLRTLGQGVQEPLWDRLPELQMPVLLIVGERDEKLAGIAREAATAIGPNAELHFVPDAGHNLLQEDPGTVADLLAIL